MLRILVCLEYQERSRVRVVCKFWNRLGLEFMCPRVEVSIRYLDHNQWPPYIRVEQCEQSKSATDLLHVTVAFMSDIKRYAGEDLFQFVKNAIGARLNSKNIKITDAVLIPSGRQDPAGQEFDFARKARLPVGCISPRTVEIARLFILQKVIFGHYI